jgi:hypothetical protein
MIENNDSPAPAPRFRQRPTPRPLINSPEAIKAIEKHRADGHILPGAQREAACRLFLRIITLLGEKVAELDAALPEGLSPDEQRWELKRRRRFPPRLDFDALYNQAVAGFEKRGQQVSKPVAKEIAVSLNGILSQFVLVEQSIELEKVCAANRARLAKEAEDVAETQRQRAAREKVEQDRFHFNELAKRLGVDVTSVQQPRA